MPPRAAFPCRIVSLVAWLACAVCVATVRAATDHLVVDEYLLRCSDGSSGAAYVELVAAGPNQTFDPNVGLRLANASGQTLLDVPGVLAPLAGQPWAEGRRFLVAMSGYAAATGTTPDVSIATPPVSPSGQLVVYLRNPATGAETVLQRVSYSTSSPTYPSPPDGRSVARQPDGVTYLVSPVASPTNSAGQLGASSCYAGARRPFAIVAFATRCASGSASGGFVDIAPTANGQYVDTDLSLRAFDRGGQLLFDLPLAQPPSVGLAWPTNQEWLAGPPGLVDAFSNPPDLAIPAAFDSVAGRVTLYGRDALGAEVILSDLVYGTPSVPAPANGQAIGWIAPNEFTPLASYAPVNFAGHACASPLCLRPLASSVRIEELATHCVPLDTTGRFVELAALASGELRDTSFALDVYDHAGRHLGRVAPGFGGASGGGWPANTSWLLGTVEYSNFIGEKPDAPLPIALDTLGGSLELSRASVANPGTREIVQRVGWGPAGFPPPGAGQSLKRVSDTSYVVSSAPSPRIADGALLGCTNVPDYSVVPMRLAELCLGCWDGDPRGQFVRLETIGNGAVLGSGYGLRVFDRRDSLLSDSPGMFAPLANARAGTYLPSSFLLAPAGYPTAGGFPDVTLAAPLDTVAGRIQLYARVDTGERDLWSVSYTRAGLGDPPPGTSARTDDETQWTPDHASPSNYLGQDLRLSGCHYIDRYGQISPARPTILQALAACVDSSDQAEHVLIGQGSESYLEPDLGLRVHDAIHGTTLTLFPLFPSPAAFTAWPSGRALLIAGARFAATTGVAPDRPLPGDLTVGAGEVDLFQRDPILGTDAMLPRGPGTSMFWDLGSNTWPPGRMLKPFFNPLLPSFFRPVVDSTFSRWDGSTGVIPAGCLATPVPMDLAEFCLGCWDGSAIGQYVKLQASAFPDLPDSTFALRTYDREGRLLAELPHVFANVAGRPLAPGTPFTITGPGFPYVADGVLPAPLDTVAGAIALVWRAGAGERVAWRTDYVRDSLGAAPFGVGWEPEPGGRLAQRTPSPVALSGASLLLPGCHYGGPPSALKPAQLLAVCGDGATDRQFLQLRSPVNTYVHPRLGIRFAIASTGVTREIFPLFPNASSFTPWPAGRSFLLGSPGFAAATGLAPDAVLPVDLATGTTTVTLFSRDSTAGPDSVLATVVEDPFTLPGPGRVLVIHDNGSTVDTAVATATRSDGGATSMPAACFDQTGSPDGVRLDAVLLACGSGASDAQYVQVAPRVAYATLSPKLRLRIRDAAGALLGERDSLFGAAGDGYWAARTAAVIAGPGFQDQFGLAPDARLPAPLDPLGGTLELVLRDAAGDRVVDSLRYGPGGVPAPPPGEALAYRSGAFAVDTLPVPHGLSGAGAPSPSCRQACDPIVYQLSFGPFQSTYQAAASFGDFQSRVSYDVPRGETSLFSGFSESAYHTRDVYALAGTPAPGESLIAHIDVLCAQRDTCALNACGSSRARLTVREPGGALDSLGRDAHGLVALRVAIPPERARSFRLALDAEVTGLLSYQLQSSLEFELEFEHLPAGAHVISCLGYDSRSAREVGDATVTADLQSVTIAWPIRDPSGFSGTVERLEGGGWAALETRPPDADGTLRFVDHDVTPSTAYRYRLTWSDRFGDHVSDEVAATVPRPFVFALHGVRPNPAIGPVSVAFELARAGEVELDLVDVSGRRVLSRRLALDAGPHVVPLASAGAIPPGVYALRLRQGDESARTTAVVLR